MFCPECRFEYAADKKKCPDCNVALVETLPDLDEPEFQELTTVFTTTSNPDLLVAQSLLEGAGVDFTVTGAVHGGAQLGISLVAGPIRIKVRPDDVEEALEILSEMNSDEDEESEE